jgi:hypothetical protein
MKYHTLNGAKVVMPAVGRESRQLGRGLELPDRIELLERAGEAVGQTPHRARRELRIPRLEIQTVDFGQQASGRLQLAIDERRVEDQLRRVVGDLGSSPQLNLALQRFEVPLDSVHADRQGVNQIEVFVCLASTGVNTPVLHM